MNFYYPHHLKFNCLSVHYVDVLKVESQIGPICPVAPPHQQIDYGLCFPQSLLAYAKEDGHGHIHMAIMTFDTLGELRMGREGISRFQYWVSIADILRILEEAPLSQVEVVEEEIRARKRV